MSKFRKKPVVIEAMTFDELVSYGIENGGNVVNGLPWSFKIGDRHVTHDVQNGEDRYLIDTLEGTMAMTRCDMLIIGVRGEAYPCKMDIFESTYEKV